VNPRRKINLENIRAALAEKAGKTGSLTEAECEAIVLAIYDLEAGQTVHLEGVKFKPDGEGGFTAHKMPAVIRFFTYTTGTVL